MNTKRTSRPPGLDRDLVLCKCERHPQIIAIQAGDSTVDEEAEKYASAARTTNVSGSATSNAYRYDQHFTLRDERTGEFWQTPHTRSLLMTVTQSKVGQMHKGARIR
jgi:hypothetical protein